MTIPQKRGARVMSAEFTWPRLRIHSKKLKTMVVRKRKKQKNRGLFVFPLQSRVTGTSYSYQWMSMAQENGWHVLLDACALGPKDMNSFGLSLIRPDFLVCSFYKVFGENPTGFGCLFVKKSTVLVLESTTSTGIVTLVPAKKLFFLCLKILQVLTQNSSKHQDWATIKNPDYPHQAVCRVLCLHRMEDLNS
ncbi:Molybdenum cofactor sulfurase [Camellia lanceoleosa]|uniref:Molybdenum cofactor sulfurase n=1 Tax=Camellia lanceoleosa TaxID=1840588 RepID=A0ACC0HEN9_9ERIC|nr:Molybdenum cofactor sulfurase [Camellia lanceoleosa]